MVKVQAARGRARTLRLTQAPSPATAITEPDHLRSASAALTPRCKPPPRGAPLAVAQDGYPPALRPSGHAVPGPRARLAQAGQHTPCDLAPAALPPGIAAVWPQRHHDASGPQRPGQGREVGRQGLGGWLMPLGSGVPLGLEGLHGLVAGRLHPTPHRPGADHTPPGPTQQPRGRRKRHEDRQGPAQRLPLPARALRRRHPSCLIQRRPWRDATALGTPSEASPPLERPQQARALALDPALPVQGRPTHGTGGPGGRTTGPLGEDGFDQLDRQNAGHLPRRQDSRGT